MEGCFIIDNNIDSLKRYTPIGPFIGSLPSMKLMPCIEVRIPWLSPRCSILVAAPHVVVVSPNRYRIPIRWLSLMTRFKPLSNENNI